MIPAVLSVVALSFPFPSGWMEKLGAEPGEPVAACAEGVSESARERFFGALQRGLAPMTWMLPLEDCSLSSMERAQRAGAERLIALTARALAVWRVDPGLWKDDRAPTRLSVHPMEAPSERLQLGSAQLHASLPASALALASCEGSLFALLRTSLLRLDDGADLDLKPLRAGPRIRAGTGQLTCGDAGLVVAHGDYQRSGVVDLRAFTWRDFSNGLLWARAEDSWLTARAQGGTNRFAPDASILRRDRLRVVDWGPWVDAVGVGDAFVRVDPAGRLRRGDEILAEGMGRGLTVLEADRPLLMVSSARPSTGPEEAPDSLLILDGAGRIQDRIPAPGPVRDLALGADAVFVLVDGPEGSQVWRMPLEGRP